MTTNQKYLCQEILFCMSGISTLTSSIIHKKTGEYKEIKLDFCESGEQKAIFLKNLLTQQSSNKLRKEIVMIELGEI